MAEEYLTKQRLVSYYNQARVVRALGKQVKTILEIGIFNSLFAELLSAYDYTITRADVDPTLKPDLILDLQSDFDLPKDQFDAIVAFQVLEHIPYEYFEEVLVKLGESTKQYVVISLPVNSLYFSLQFHFSFAQRFRNLLLQIPKFWSTTPITADHYWEIGLKGYPLQRVIDSIENSGLILTRQYQDPLHPYHYFFVMEKSKSKALA